MRFFHVTYAAENWLVKGHLAVEDRRLRAPSGTLRGFVYCRGGIGRIGMVKDDWLVRFARHGAVVMAPSYRGNEGGEGREDFGLRDRTDAMSAVSLTRTLPLVDPADVTVYGFSRGGPMALFCAMEPLGLRAAVVHGGVADLALTYEQRVDLRRMLRRVTGGPPRRFPDAYRLRSPVHRAADIRCPVLIIHGSADVQVDISHARMLQAALSAARIPHDCWILEGEGHHLTPARFDHLIDRMFAWIARTEGPPGGPGDDA